MKTFALIALACATFVAPLNDAFAARFFDPGNGWVEYGASAGGGLSTVNPGPARDRRL